MSTQYLYRCKLRTETPPTSAKRSNRSCYSLSGGLFVRFCQVNFFLHLACGMLRSILVMWRSKEDVIFQPWRLPISLCFLFVWKKLCMRTLSEVHTPVTEWESSPNPDCANWQGLQLCTRFNQESLIYNFPFINAIALVFPHMTAVQFCGFTYWHKV